MHFLNDWGRIGEKVPGKKCLFFYVRNLKNIFAKQNIESIKQKAKDEMRDAINKDVYLDPEDAKLISQFIKKIQKELQDIENE